MTCPLEDYVQGWDRSQFSLFRDAVKGRSQVLFEHRHVMASRVPSDSDSLHIAQQCLCVVPYIREVA